MDEMLGTTIGTATVFSALLDLDRDIQIVFDKDVEKEEWYGCSDGTTTSYMKIKTSQIIETFLPYTKYKPRLIDL